MATQTRHKGKTMKKTLISMAAIMALSAAAATAQNKRLSKSNAKAEAEKEAKLLEQRIDQMVAATQRIIFIDSVVVDKENFLSKYNLSRDAGSVYSYENYYEKIQKQIKRPIICVDLIKLVKAM